MGAIAEKVGYDRTYVLGEDMATAFVGVVYDSTAGVVKLPASDGEEIVGVLQEAGVTGEGKVVVSEGVSRVTPGSGQTWAYGAPLMVEAATGKFKQWSVGGNRVRVGRAEDALATGNTYGLMALRFGGEVNLLSDITIGGDITLENGEIIKNDTNGQVDIVGDLVLSGKLDVGGAAGIILSNDETITNAVNGEVLVTGALAATGGLDVRGAAGITLENDETITNAVNGEVLVTGALAVTGALDVQGGNITLQNDEQIKNDTNGQIDFVTPAVNLLGGTTGGLKVAAAEATVTLSGASGDIAVNIPSGAVILGCQLRVDTAVTSGDGAVSWTAAYKTGATQQIATGQAFTKNTKVNKMFDANAATPIASGTTVITITPNANTFSGGVIRAIAYYLTVTAMADAV